MNEKRNNIIQRIKELSVLLDGEMEQTITSNSTGRQSKKIVIEYDVNQKKQ